MASPSEQPPTNVETPEAAAFYQPESPTKKGKNAVKQPDLTKDSSATLGRSQVQDMTQVPNMSADTNPLGLSPGKSGTSRHGKVHITGTANDSPTAKAVRQARFGTYSKPPLFSKSVDMQPTSSKPGVTAAVSSAITKAGTGLFNSLRNTSGPHTPGAYFNSDPASPDANTMHTPHEHASTRDDHDGNTSLFAQPEDDGLDDETELDVEAELADMAARDRGRSAPNIEYDPRVRFEDNGDGIHRDVVASSNNVTKRRPRKTDVLPNALLNPDGTRGPIQMAKEHTDGTDETLYKIHNAQELVAAVQDDPDYWFIVMHSFFYNVRSTGWSFDDLYLVYQEVEKDNVKLRDDVVDLNSDLRAAQGNLAAAQDEVHDLRQRNIDAAKTIDKWSASHATVKKHYQQWRTACIDKDKELK